MTITLTTQPKITTTHVVVKAQVKDGDNSFELTDINKLIAYEWYVKSAYATVLTLDEYLATNPPKSEWLSLVKFTIDKLYKTQLN